MTTGWGKPINHMVLLPIVVPIGNYCWDATVCPHFNNEGGHPKCDLKLDYKDTLGLKYNNQGKVEKPDFCLKLEVQSA
jgi:hypothetical protein